MNETKNVDDTPRPVTPPVAGKIPKADVIHGELRVDEYFWLREKGHADVAAYLNAENEYTEAVMKPAEALRAALYKEMLGRIRETDVSVPYRNGDYVYYSRTEQGRQYPIHCRKRGGPDGAEEITLDLNAMAVGREFMSLEAYAVSDDGNWLAFSTDDTGFRQYTLRFKDLRTGVELPERVEKTGSCAWAADNSTLFYTVEDAAKRQYRLYRHRLGDPVDELILEERDEAFNIEVSRTRSRDYLILTSSSHTTSEARFLRADDPFGEWSLIAPRVHDQEYDVDHRGGDFYIRVNDTGRNFRLVSAPAAGPGRDSWQELVPHNPRVMLESADLFRDYCVLLEREDGLPHLRVMVLDQGSAHRIAFNEAVYSVTAATNKEFDTQSYRFNYQSLVTPASVFDYDMATRQSVLLKQTEVLGGYDAAQYQSERLFASAPDGTPVPVSVVYRKDRRRDGGNPLHLTGYGSYGISMPTSFSSNRISLLDRGVVCAFAHIRGGGDLGKPWHDAGRMLNKKNTFTDFIAVAEFLVAARWTSPQQLVIEGGSAGGLLMGAVTNQRPELFAAVISKVPFVDVVNTMLDESLPLTVGEFEEWGNPKKKDEYDYINSYCPYTNLRPGPFPAMLVKTSFNDSQVMYWEPAKYVARLRTLKKDDKPLLLKTNMAAGHGGASGRYDALREAAFDYAFILSQVGVAQPVSDSRPHSD